MVDSNINEETITKAVDTKKGKRKTSQGRR